MKHALHAEMSESSRHQGKWRVLSAGCLAHFTHDGFTDMLYIFFPIWQQFFSLSFTEIGFLRTLFSGTMAGFQLPSGIVVDRMGPLNSLMLGAILTGLALACTAFAPSVFLLFLLLVIGGAGSSAQHPVSSSAISNTYGGAASRVALGTYNFSGDIGKLLFPSAAAVLIVHLGWQKAIGTLGICGFLSASIILALLYRNPPEILSNSGPALSARFSFLLAGGSFSFVALSCIGILDSATRTALLTFLPFLLRSKAADMPALGMALSLIFAGGAAGKFVCGVAATRVGPLRTVIATELATAIFIYALPLLPVRTILLLCPLLGIALNGTSSVLYGSVPELVAYESRNNAFAFFYTCTIGAGALSPFLYGVVGDHLGIAPTLTIVAAIATVTIPLTIPLRGRLARY
jgi:MFS family permease